MAVRDAALPYHIIDARTGREVAADDFYAALAGAEAICVGEQHTEAHDHWAQLEVLDKVTAKGGSWGLGMEMVQRPFQGVLDDFREGRIDQAALLSRTGWADRWVYDFLLYEPMISLAVARAATLLALNTERELLKKVSRGGLAALSERDRAKLPELVLDVAEHREWFEAVMAEMGGAHGHTRAAEGDSAESSAEEARAAPAEAPGPHDAAAGGHDAAAGGHDAAPAPHHGAPAPHHGAPAPHHGAPASHDAPDGATPALTGEAAKATLPAAPVVESMADRVYAAQVVWDETMAETAFGWLRSASGEGSSRQIVILAGNGHCHDTAIVGRLKRRGAERAVSVHPMVDDGEGNVADALASPMNDYLFVMSPRK